MDDMIRGASSELFLHNWQFRNVHTNILLNCSFPKNNYLVEENITDVQFQDTCSLASGAKCAISATGMCYV